MLNKCSSFHQRILMGSSKILSSSTVFNIDINICFLSSKSSY